MGIKEIYHSKFRWLGVALMILPLLSSCIREEEFNNSPQGNFEALWKIIDEQYCFLDYKQIDWDAIHDKYQPLITSNMGNDGLFQVLDSMLAELKDGHVNLYKCGPLLGLVSGLSPKLQRRYYRTAISRKDVPHRCRHEI